jgi:hypothetical protein
MAEEPAGSRARIVKRVLQEYALANDVGLQFSDVPVGLVKMLLFPSAIHGFVPTTDTLRV